jgi:hypothetical protein
MGHLAALLAKGETAAGIAASLAPTMKPIFAMEKVVPERIRRMRPLRFPPNAAAASGAGFGGAQPPSTWFDPPVADACAGDVLRQNVQELSRSPTYYPSISVDSELAYDDLCGFLRVTETSGPILEPGRLLRATQARARTRAVPATKSIPGGQL